MADWCYYAVGFNCDSVIDAYEEALVKDQTGGNREDYEEAYGYQTPLLHVEEENLSLFYPEAKDIDDAVDNGCKGLSRDVEGEVLVTSEHPNFRQICALIRQSIWPDYYYVEGEKRDWGDAMEYANSADMRSLCVCEIEPPQ